MRAIRRSFPPPLLWSLLVALGGLVGGLVALWSFSAGYRLSVGTITVSVSPFHHGALDVYVPLVDWGVRFPGVTMPARLNVAVQAVDRDSAASIAQGGLATIDALRDEASGAIASYLKLLALICGAASLALGLLVAAAARPFREGRLRVAATPDEASPTAMFRTPAGSDRAGRFARHRWWSIPVGTVSLGWMAAIALLLAPRGDLPSPVYYAHGADIPVALEAITSAGRSPGGVSSSFENQIQGLARLVIDPGRRPDLSGRPRLTIASDMHNNVLVTPTLERAAAGGPVLFAGDLTDTGSALEVSAALPVVRTGGPFVFVAGNHDSDTSLQALARRGAIVLTARGQLLPSGRYGAMTARIDGLRVAGYGSPFMRLAREQYRDRGTGITEQHQREFAAWFAGIAGEVDVVMVHEPALAAPVIEQLRRERSERPGDAEAPSILFVLGDTHRPAIDAAEGVLAVNGGTIGAGGTGNLGEGQDASLAIVTYDEEPFTPLATDIVTLDPGTGETIARRVRIDRATPLQIRDPVESTG